MEEGCDDLRNYLGPVLAQSADLHEVEGHILRASTHEAQLLVLRIQGQEQTTDYRELQSSNRHTLPAQ
jgi:hypothetical protein